MIHDIVTNFITLLKKKVGTKLKKFDNMKIFFSSYKSYSLSTEENQ